MTAPPVSPELARAALDSQALSRARALATWVGEGRTLTVRGVLRPADAIRACQDLGIATRGPRLRSALDVPALMMDWVVAAEAGFLEIGRGRARASLDWLAGPAPDAQLVLTRWGSAVIAVLGLDLQPCPECMTVLYELHLADGPLTTEQLTAAVAAVVEPDDPSGGYCPDCGVVHDSYLDDILDTGPEDDPAEHVADTVARLGAFGATEAAGGGIRLTPLGTMLAELVLHMHTPLASATAGAVVDAVAELPPDVAWHVARRWLDARSAEGAARELLAFAEQAPVAGRTVALSLVTDLGAGTAAAWREWAARPGFGAYAREWLREQGAAVPEDPADELWLAVEALCLLVDRLDGTLPPAAVAQVLAEQAGELAEGIAQSGHPRAAELASLLGGPAAAGDSQRTYQLKITLRGVSKPPVWRRVLVGADITLRRLHGVIQDAMGWEDGHLYVFSAGRREFSSCEPELGHADDRWVRLSLLLVSPGDELRYTYDFGDDWEHDILLEECRAAAPGEQLPACVAGKGACPPEDCGGTPGYARLRELVADPEDPEHDEILEWLGIDSGAEFDPAAFSVAEADARLRPAERDARGLPLAQAPGRPGER